MIRKRIFKMNLCQVTKKYESVLTKIYFCGILIYKCLDQVDYKLSSKASKSKTVKQVLYEALDTPIAFV